MQAFLITSTILFWTGVLFAITLMFILRRTAEEEPEVEYYKDKVETLRNEKITLEAMTRAAPVIYSDSDIDTHYLDRLDEIERYDKITKLNESADEGLI